MSLMKLKEIEGVYFDDSPVPLWGEHRMSKESWLHYYCFASTKSAYFAFFIRKTSLESSLAFNFTSRYNPHTDRLTGEENAALERINSVKWAGINIFPREVYLNYACTWRKP